MERSEIEVGGRSMAKFLPGNSVKKSTSHRKNKFTLGVELRVFQLFKRRKRPLQSPVDGFDIECFRVPIAVDPIGHIGMVGCLGSAIASQRCA